jgi:hypothetical protein
VRFFEGWYSFWGGGFLGIALGHASAGNLCDTTVAVLLSLICLFALRFLERHGALA